MAHKSFFLALLFCILSLGQVLPSSAQDSPKDFLDAHNAARKEVGVAPLEWDEKLVSYAQNYANKRKDCVLEHSGGPHGENIAASNGQDLSGTEAVDLWVKEKSNYDYAANKCTSSGECLHYTQVVWAKTKHLGCAKVQCDEGKGAFITCNYDPPGNFIGEKPY